MISRTAGKRQVARLRQFTVSEERFQAHASQLCAPLSDRQEHVDSPELSGRDSHRVPHASGLAGIRQAALGGQGQSTWGRSHPTTAAPYCLASPLAGWVLPGHSAYLQVSDVVHHSPPFDREALGGDIVVVDLQSNKCISGRSSTTSLTHSRTGNATSALMTGDTRSQSVILSLLMHSEACKRTTNVRKPAS